MSDTIEGLAYKTRPLYAGKPWFLPIIGNWWRARLDWTITCTSQCCL